MATKLKKKFKKIYIFLNGRPFNPPPPFFLMSLPLRNYLFFAASLIIKKIFKQKKVINIFIEGGGISIHPY